MPRWRMPFAHVLHINKVRCAKHARENSHAPATLGRGRGRGRGGGGGRHVRGGPAGRHSRAPCPRGTVARRAAPARVAATLKTELKLVAVSDNAPDFDADEEWEADFKEDVFNAESASSAHGSDEEDAVESEHDPDASDLDDSYDGYVEEHHQEHNDAAPGGAEEDAYALALHLSRGVSNIGFS